MNGSSHRFRLERVRALRERREDEAKQELANAMASRRTCETALDAAAQRIERARRAQLDVGVSSPADFLARQAYLERVEQAHTSTLEDLHRHDEAVADRRTVLTAAAQERQALERLKAKSLAEHRREDDRRESATLDEIAINGHRRRAA